MNSRTVIIRTLTVLETRLWQWSTSTMCRKPMLWICLPESLAKHMKTHQVHTLSFWHSWAGPRLCWVKVILGCKAEHIEQQPLLNWFISTCPHPGFHKGTTSSLRSQKTLLNGEGSLTCAPCPPHVTAMAANSMALCWCKNREVHGSGIYHEDKWSKGNHRSVFYVCFMAQTGESIFMHSCVEVWLEDRKVMHQWVYSKTCVFRFSLYLCLHK